MGFSFINEMADSQIWTLELVWKSKVEFIILVVILFDRNQLKKYKFATFINNKFVKYDKDAIGKKNNKNLLIPKNEIITTIKPKNPFLELVKIRNAVINIEIMKSIILLELYLENFISSNENGRQIISQDTR